MEANHWLPLTEYALRSGMSISTLRRKIKANSIQYKMEEGRYLIRLDGEEEEAPAVNAVKRFESNDSVVAVPERVEPRASVDEGKLFNELRQIREELKKNGEDGGLKWRALEARVSGLAKKLDFFAEQVGELKMLVKIFEERLDERL